MEKAIIKAAKSVYKKWLLKGYLNGHRYKIMLKRDFETAAWTFRKENGVNVNYIFIGDKTVEMVKDGVAPEKFVERQTNHELGHSVYTHRNFEAIDRALKRIDAPFELLNVFDDCRMEGRVRDEKDYEFRWPKYRKKKYMGFGEPEPKWLLNTVRNFEGNDLEEAMRAFMDANFKKGVSELDSLYIALRVTEYYYPEALKCKTTLDLIPLIKEWVEEFPDDKSSCQGGGGGNGDIAIAFKLSEDDDAFEKFMQSCEQIEGYVEQEDENQEDAPSNTVGEHTTANLTDDDLPYDRDLFRKLLPRFERILCDEARSIASTRPSKRLCVRNVLRGSEKIYKRKEEEAIKHKSITLVYDCSGSMWQVMQEAKLVAALTNALAKKGLVEGYLILSGTRGYHTIKFPTSESDIDAIGANGGGEGLQKTFEQTLPLLQKSDLVFCITDGELSDEPIDQRMLRSRGIDVVGMYVGEQRVNLGRWFSKSIWRKNITSLIDEVVRKIK